MRPKAPWARGARRHRPGKSVAAPLIRGWTAGDPTFAWSILHLLPAAKPDWFWLSASSSVDLAPQLRSVSHWPTSPEQQALRGVSIFSTAQNHP